MSEFKTTPGFMPEHPDTLVLHCSDGRFTKAVFELLRNCGCSRYDVMALPGGPALLDMSGASITETETFRASSGFLIRGHKVTTVHLIAHEGCGYYRSKFAGMTPTSVRDKQIDDLHRAANWIKRTNSGILVLAYYAIVSGGSVVFHDIQLDPKKQPVY